MIFSTCCYFYSHWCPGSPGPWQILKTSYSHISTEMAHSKITNYVPGQNSMSFSWTCWSFGWPTSPYPLETLSFFGIHDTSVPGPLPSIYDFCLFKLSSLPLYLKLMLWVSVISPISETMASVILSFCNFMNVKLNLSLSLQLPSQVKPF